MSLIELANNDAMPKDQYMDKETLKWICDNSIKGIDLRTNYYAKSYKKFIPDLKWFPFNNKINSIHGLRHLIRVSIFCEIIKYNYWWLFLKSDLKNILTAAILHDIRRLDDRDDIGHGQRSADWFLKNIKALQEWFNVHYSKRDTEVIYNAIFYHEIPYNSIDKKIYKKNKRIIDIIKTADALDRYRLPKLKWRINEDYLNFKPSQKLKIFAYKLVCQTEKMFLKEPNNIQVNFSKSLKIINNKEYEERR